MNLSTISSPGVYINEVNAFPNSVNAVATAIPAFIGYTPQAMYEGKSYQRIATKISSFAEFQAIFCYPDPALPAPSAKQYNPQYYLVPQKSKPAGNYMAINNTYYSILPDPNTVYYFYNSIRLFYENGGGDAYIVSVGTYGAPSKKPMDVADPLINPNVQLNDLLGGLSQLLNEQEPTMYICPEATLLSVADNGTLMQSMLQQCGQIQTAISVFDIIGGKSPDPLMYMNDITTFRQNTGTNGLSYGAAYYPFVGTTIVQKGDIDYTNLFGGDVSQLAPIINPPSNSDPVVTAILNNILHPTGPPVSVAQNNNALIVASPTYESIMTNVLNDANLLPPSGGMAGVMTTVDAAEGVWESPANTSITGVVSLPIYLSDNQQGDLNVDSVSGKSINALRKFNGIGILVWGARTLDGNSDDWKYISVRRTLIMIEQSCKLAIQPYVFQPNNNNTWVAVKSTLISFLTSIWKQGGLMGPTPSQAFSVDCGLGTSMTGDDILNGFMSVFIQVAVIRPAEFIVINLRQEMATSS